MPRSAALDHLRRLYAVLSGVHQALVRATTRDELLTGVCQAAVEQGCRAAARIPGARGATTMVCHPYVLPCLACALAAAAEPTWHRVALDDAATGEAPPHLSSGATYRFPERDLPTSMVPAADPLRWCLFGAPLVLEYKGLVPAASYKLKLSFLSDAPRTAKLLAGGQVVLPNIALEKGKPLTLEALLPPASYAGGALRVEMAHTSGPNAVVGRVEVLSTDKAPLALPPAPAPVVPPRLSPRPVSAGAEPGRVDLGGTWRFHPAPPADFHRPASPTGDGWHDIRVPGEWTMQGFSVAPRSAAGYRRAFTVPAAWAGQRIKLKADAVYSDCAVWVNGAEAGRHQGGFTPFELDITELVKPGAANTLALAVRNESAADTIASGTKYATHPLGGIPRKLYLFALPPVNLAAVHADAQFTTERRTATLAASLTVANETQAPAANVTLGWDLADPAGREVFRVSEAARLPTLAAGQSATVEARRELTEPQLWDPEHPRLYRLTVRLLVDGQVVETVTERIGLREVAVRGNQVFVNGRPVKLRGVCRHEVHPLTGRAGTAALARRDAQLFKEGNCNFIRTSHYPPTEEFLDACDEIGLFVGSEAPLCWSPGAGHRELLVGQALAMVRHNRNHPCIIYWSLGNESRWGSDYEASSKAIAAFHPPIPRIFSDGTGYSGPAVDLISRHYPGLGGPGAAASAPKPVIFDEYIHLNCYNRHELETDPGLRDLWGRGFAEMWERMLASQGCLGGAIWAAIDDTFFVPPDKAVGYGTWGPIDGWRRPKPEYFHMQRIYAPLRISGEVAPGQPIRLSVRNRQDFSDLSELRFDWTLGAERGTATTSAPPGGTGTLVIEPQRGAAAAEALEVAAVTAQGLVVERCRFPLRAPAPPAVPAATGPMTLARGPVLTIAGPGWRYEVDAATGQLRAPLVAGPILAFAPLNGGGGGNQMTGKDSNFPPLHGLCSNWQAKEVSAREADGAVEIKVTGEYAEAAGGYTLRFEPTGVLTVDYAFTVTSRLEPRQIGLVFAAPKSWDTLSWRRQAQWSVYPDDHIGRPVGTAKAFYAGPLCGSAGPRTEPTWPWSQDSTPSGSNDFRATKANLWEAALRAGNGQGVRVLSDGRQHLRCWVQGDQVRFLVADYSNEGAAPFFNEHVIARRTLGVGAKVEGRARLVG